MKMVKKTKSKHMKDLEKEKGVLVAIVLLSCV